jgi:hypothetical protein
MSTPRTDAEAGTLIDADEVVPADFARTLERELAAERDKAERYRLATLKLDAELHAEREKVRVLRLACERIVWQWDKDHDANPISAGGRMYSWASKVLAATEDKP